VGRLLACLALALVVAAPAAARNPRLEHLALRPADMASARNAVLRAADLGSGWTGTVENARDDSAPDCAFQDYSKFTITGQAQTRFSQQGASVVSRVEVYKSRADALGDFGVDTQPRTALCEGRAIRDGFAKQAAKGMTVTLTSAKRLAAPQVGERSVAFRIVLTITQQARSLKLYIDLIGFVRDRAAASVVVVAPAKPAKGAVSLARVMDARLSRAA
jgi:hypothetical protein